MTLDEARAAIGQIVKWPRTDNRKGSRAFGKGRIVGVEGKHAVVQIFPRHRQPEKLKPGPLRLWMAKGNGNSP